MNVWRFGGKWHAWRENGCSVLLPHASHCASRPSGCFLVITGNLVSKMFPEFCEPSSKSIEPEEGVLGTSDLYLVGQKHR